MRVHATAPDQERCRKFLANLISGEQTKPCARRHLYGNEDEIRKREIERAKKRRIGTSRTEAIRERRRPLQLTGGCEQGLNGGSEPLAETGKITVLKGVRLAIALLLNCSQLA